MTLPFTQIIPGRTPPRSFWQAPSTGDAQMDEAVGTGHAEALLTHLQQTPDTFLMSWIIGDMTGRPLTPMQIAFWERIALQCCK